MPEYQKVVGFSHGNPVYATARFKKGKTKSAKKRAAASGRRSRLAISGSPMAVNVEEAVAKKYRKK